MTNTNEGYSVRERLERFGAPRASRRWETGEVNYLEQLGLTEEDTPELLAIAREWAEPMDWPEDEDYVAGFAPIHAWRGLAQLRATEAVPVLLAMMDRLDELNDDWFLGEFPRVFARIGPDCLEPVAAYLADPSHKVFSRIAAADTFAKLAERHPSTRERGVEVLSECLSRFDETDETVNAYLVTGLLDLKATEAAELIERAHAAGRVDLCVNGNWNTVRGELGVEGLGLVPEALAGARPFGSFMPSPDEGQWPQEDMVQADPPLAIRTPTKMKRNQPCPCGSGRKYKKCCGRPGR